MGKHICIKHILENKHVLAVVNVTTFHIRICYSQCTLGVLYLD